MTKASIYQELLEEIKSVLEGEEDSIANMANAAAIIHEKFGHWWTGFYLVKEEELVLGPFQGPVACTRIRKGRGVCGTSWSKGQTEIVPNVHNYPGHIACSSESNSEIVIPIKDENGEVRGVLDIDSRLFNAFDKTDAEWLEKICNLINLK